MSMKKIFLGLALLLFLQNINAQNLFTKTGQIQFNSKFVVEKIEAVNNATAMILNKENGDVKIALNIKSFVFENQLMQEHFNENYMESDKYPKSNFEGN